MRIVRSASLALVLAATAAHAASPLDGRVAGKPVNCVPIFQLDESSGFQPDGSLLYGGAGSTIYVNHPDNCPRVPLGAAYSSTTPTGSYCRGDIITIFDPVSHIPYGSCSLGEFTPYAKPHHAKAG